MTTEAILSRVKSLLVIDLQYHVWVSVMGCVYILYTAAYLELSDVWSVCTI